MASLRIRAGWMVLVAVPVWTTVGRADPPKPGKARAPADAVSALKTGRPPAAATVEKIMEQAVRNIAARYNLNKAQTEETGKLMKREVHRFLQEHENEVWPVIRDLLKWQFRPPSDREEAIRTGKAASPLLKLAEEAIFRANEEWRLILTPEQKRVHDFDLREMKKTFGQIEKNFANWEAGRPPKQGLFPEPQVMADEPPRPSRPPEGLPEPEVAVFDPVHIFDALVKEFIEEYGLDEGQITSARSILEEFKTKARDFRASKKVEFAAIMAQLREAHERRDVAAVKKVTAAHKKLLEPVYELTSQLEDRLKGLLTTAQIQRHAEKMESAEKTPKVAAATKKTASKKGAGSTPKAPGADSASDRDN